MRPDGDLPPEAFPQTANGFVPPWDFGASRSPMPKSWRSGCVGTSWPSTTSPNTCSRPLWTGAGRTASNRRPHPGWSGSSTPLSRWLTKTSSQRRTPRQRRGPFQRGPGIVRPTKPTGKNGVETMERRLPRRLALHLPGRFRPGLLTRLFATLSAKREQGPHSRPHGRLTRYLQARLILSGIRARRRKSSRKSRENRGKTATFGD
jgi:hypothetical protein